MWWLHTKNSGWHLTGCLVIKYPDFDEWDVFPWCTCRRSWDKRHPRAYTLIYGRCSKK